MIDRYLATTYEHYARGPDKFDCWGLVRDARVEMFGKELLPSYCNTDPKDKKALTAGCKAVQAEIGFAPVAIRPGAIATAWRARLCVHVGIVVEADGALWILETDEATGPCLTRPGRFAARYTEVIYYDN